jgi:hypothetical protein
VIGEPQSPCGDCWQAIEVYVRDRGAPQKIAQRTVVVVVRGGPGIVS